MIGIIPIVVVFVIIFVLLISFLFRVNSYMRTMSEEMKRMRFELGKLADKDS